MTELTHQIFDRIFKYILLSSARAVILLINGLFQTSYSLDSTITYNLTEHLNETLAKTLADNILTVNNSKSHHIEAQMTKDTTIPFRVFDYGYKHAASHRGILSILNFPESLILYLGDNQSVPDKETITVNFGGAVSVTFGVNVFKVLDYTIEQLDQRNLILLIPFLLLKFRKKVAKSRSPEVIKQLQSFILHDIIKTIKKNVAAGNLTELDSVRLWEVTCKLYQYLYSHYEEFKVEGGLNDMIEDNFTLEVDRMHQEWVLETDRLNQEWTLETDRLQQEWALETDRLHQEWARKTDQLQQEWALETDRKQQEWARETDRKQQEWARESDRLQQELDDLEKKSVKSIFHLTRDLVKTAAELNLSIPQVQKRLNELQIPYQPV